MMPLLLVARLSAQVVVGDSTFTRPAPVEVGDSLRASTPKLVDAEVIDVWRDTMVIASLTDSLARLRVQLSQLGDSLRIAHSIMDGYRDQMNYLSRIKDSLVVSNSKYQRELQAQNRQLEEKIRALQEKEQLVAEKEQLYKEAISSSTVDKAKFQFELQAKEVSITAKEKEIEMMQRNIDARDSSLKDEKNNYRSLLQERNRYMHIVDSLRAKVVAAEMENVKKQEENKYLAERAKAAEEKVATATNRKKKVRPVQGIAMKFYRTPDWNIRLTADNKKQIWNRNAGSIEFDYITGASVMLWDMTNYFNPKGKTDTTFSTFSGKELRRFDQQFAYDLGVYVGFGGSNLFKNFYVGPSFRFMDFFYLVVGVNVCEYEVLTDGRKDGTYLTGSESLTDITAHSWLVKPFVALSIDLDFLSYIKK